MQTTPDRLPAFPPSRMLILGLLLLLPLWGCSQEPQTTSNLTSQSLDREQTAQAEQGNSVRMIEHAMGTTKIEGTPKRVVVLTNEATDNVLALGVKPVGAVQSWMGNPYYDYIEAEMRGVPVVGQELEPSLEKIATLQPDLIVGSKVRHQQVYTQLSAIAPTVFSETLGADWKENLKLYAQALNREQEAQKILAFWNQRIDDFQTKMGKKLNQEVSLVRFSPGMARIYYQDNFPGRILKEVGLQRPPSQQQNQFAAEVTLEQISQMGGDVLFYMTFETGEGEATQLEKSWTSHPLWQNLEVVQQDQAYKVNDIYWTTAGGVQAANRMLDDLYRYFLQSDG